MTQETYSSHQVAIILEALRSDFKAVIDHVSGVEIRLSREIQEHRAETQIRFDTIEAVLHDHTQRFKENGKRWERNEVRLIRIEDRLTRVEDRLVRLEDKFDRLEYRVERHDREIKTLPA